MRRYMLDTDTVSYALRGHGHVSTRILERLPSEVSMSSITLAELRYGAERVRSRRLHRLIDSFAKSVATLPFDSTTADHFGTIAAFLARRGTPIGGFDTLIAAHATALGLILVTNNAGHFGRVAGLKTENWV